MKLGKVVYGGVLTIRFSYFKTFRVSFSLRLNLSRLYATSEYSLNNSNPPLLTSSSSLSSRYFMRAYRCSLSELAFDSAYVMTDWGEGGSDSPGRGARSEERSDELDRCSSAEVEVYKPSQLQRFAPNSRILTFCNRLNRRVKRRKGTSKGGPEGKEES